MPKTNAVGNIDMIPKKKSELNGWQNITVRKCGKECCEVVFPENFRYGNKKQLLALRSLVNNELEHDVDCMMRVREDALKHIRFLSTDKQDVDATILLLSPNTFGGFNLDGTLAEDYPGEFQLLVLEKYQKLIIVLNVKKQEEVSTDLCSWLEVLGEVSDRERVKELIVQLKSQQLNGFAAMVADKCGNVLR